MENQIQNRALVLFVHGLGGKSAETWGKFQTLINQDEELATACDVAFFDFPTSLVALPFGIKPLKIQDLASALKTEISLKYHSYNRMIIVAHSLGGLIAQRYIIDLENYKLPNPVSDILLFGTPNYGSLLARIGLAFSLQHWQMFQLTPHSEIITQISEDWLRLECDSRFRALYVVGGQDSVVERSSASRVRGVGVETIADKGHINLVKPETHKDSSYLLVKRAIQGSDYGKKLTKKGHAIASTTIRQQGQVLSRHKSLFERYTEDRELYYIARREDLLLNEYLKFRHVWVWGASGYGKTSALIRASIVGRLNAKFISLGHYEGGNAKDIFRGLAAELVHDPNDKISGDLSWPELIDRVSQALHNHAAEGTSHFLIEEIPLTAGAHFDTFISKLNLLIIKMASSDNNQISFLFSSIVDPTAQIAAVPKMAELSKVVCFHRWRNMDINDLISRIMNDTGLRLTPTQQDELKAKACNSPRLVKIFFLNFSSIVAYGGVFADALADTFRDVA